MNVFNIIVSVLNFMFACIILYFCKGLSWGNTDDRFSMVGFGSMIALYLIDIALILM